MAKSGRERKAKRKMRQQAQSEVDELGTHWANDTPENVQENNALIRRSQRWLTDSGLDDFEERAAGEDGEPVDFGNGGLVGVRNLSAREIAIVVTRRNMLSADPNVALSAVRNLISMESQNQADEHHVTPTGDGQLNAQTQQIRYRKASDDQLLEARQALIECEEGEDD